jgi:hypothetical protein
MDENRSRRRDRLRQCEPHPDSAKGMQFSLQAEEQLFRAFSSRASLPDLLNRICSALDCQIGNVVSLISLPGDDATDLAVVAGNARLFGLYIFCSAGVLDENDKPLGSLETYCCVPRSPSPEDFQLIDRATCLAAIAIDLHKEAGRHANRWTPGRAFARSGYVN